MVHEYIFPLGVSDITIKSAVEIPDKFLEDISVLIENFENDINKNLIGSSAYKFHSGQINIPIFVKEEFQDFLIENMKHIGTDTEFKPFKTNEEIKDINDFLIIDRQSLSVIKKKEISLNSNILNKYYIVDAINQYMIENKKLGYLLTTDTIQSSFGKLRWKTDFPIEGEDIHLKLLNQNAILEVIDESKINKQSPKFANPDRELIPDKIVLIGENKSVNLKILSYKISNLYFKYDFVRFKEKYKLEIIVVDKNGEVIII